MTIQAVCIKDSVSPDGVRLTTMQLRYPRFIHSEVMTHRVFSRNASSSRAIPVSKMIRDILRDPAVPISWGKNKPGMQATEDMVSGRWLWMIGLYLAVVVAWVFSKLGYHKQIVNRVLEPYMHMNVLVTATEWDNFFKLRIHADAQPEIAELAYQMKVAMRQSIPQKLHWGQWHLPYINYLEYKTLPLPTLKQVSSARCASVSYKTVDGRPMTTERAMGIFEKLNTDPLHASAFEHCATPWPECSVEHTRNFRGWAQYRASLELGLGDEKGSDTY